VQGGIALALGVWFAFHLDPVVPALAVLCAVEAAAAPRGPLLGPARLIPGGRGRRAPLLPERLTLGIEAATLAVAAILLRGPASRIGDLLALATGIVAAVDATSTLSPGRWLAGRIGPDAPHTTRFDPDDPG
jgi:hypothetical protein